MNSGLENALIDCNHHASCCPGIDAPPLNTLQPLRSVLLSNADLLTNGVRQALLHPLLSELNPTSSLTTLHNTLPRWYAAQARASGVPPGAYTSPMAAARPSSVRVTMVSSNLLAEPYKGEPSPLPWSSWVTPTGWKERWKRWVNSAKSIYTIAKIRKNVPGWKLPAFKQEALTLYMDVCEALAAGNRTSLRQMVTPSVFSDMKRQIKAREEGGWARIDWAVTKPIEVRDLEVVQGRLIAIDPKNDNTGFAQLTVKMPSQQRFAAYDAKGRLVAGNPEESVTVEDVWVFERPLMKQAANRWRLAGRLSVPNDASEKSRPP